MSLKLDKKLICPDCGVKSAVFDFEKKGGRCHICGKEVAELSTEIIGNFDVIQKITNENFRFLEFKVDLKKYKIEEKEKTGKVTITIYEDG